MHSPMFLPCTKYNLSKLLKLDFLPADRYYWSSQADQCTGSLLTKKVLFKEGWRIFSPVRLLRSWNTWLLIYLCHLMPAKHVMQKDERLHTDKNHFLYPLQRCLAKLESDTMVKLYLLLFCRDHSSWSHLLCVYGIYGINSHLLSYKLQQMLSLRSKVLITNQSINI